MLAYVFVLYACFKSVYNIAKKNTSTHPHTLEQHHNLHHQREQQQQQWRQQPTVKWMLIWGWHNDFKSNPVFIQTLSDCLFGFRSVSPELCVSIKDIAYIPIHSQIDIDEVSAIPWLLWAFDIITPKLTLFIFQWILIFDEKCQCGWHARASGKYCLSLSHTQYRFSIRLFLASIS